MSDTKNIPAHVEMAREVARAWIEERAKTEFRMTIFMPSFDDMVYVKRLFRHMSASVAGGKARVANLSAVQILPGLDSLTLVSPQEGELRKLAKHLESKGFEVDWGW